MIEIGERKAVKEILDMSDGTAVVMYWDGSKEDMLLTQAMELKNWAERNQKKAVQVEDKRYETN